MMNPLKQLDIISLRQNVTPFQRQVAANNAALREHLGKYVRARKSGERKTKVQGESDILTLLL